MNTPGRSLRIVAVWLVLALFLSPAHAQRVLSLSADESQYHLAPFLDVFKDGEASLSVEDILAEPYWSQFRPLRSPEPNFGYTSSPIWLRCTLKNEELTRHEYMLELAHTLIGDIRVYLFRDLKPSQEERAGMFRSFSEREIPYRNPVFSVPLEAGETVSIILRIESPTSITLPLKVWRGADFVSTARDAYMFYGLFYGMLLIMALYNFFLFIVIKDVSYLYYVLGCLSYALYQFVVDGLAHQYLWPDSTWWYPRSPYIGSTLGIIFMMLFSRQFLRTRQLLGGLDNILIGFIVVVGVLTLYLLLLPEIPSGVFTPPLSWAYILLSIMAGILCWKRGNRVAGLYLLATSGLLFGLMMRTVKLYGGFEDTVLSQFGLQIGILFEMTLLSFALGNRIKTVTEAKENEKMAMRTRIARDLHDEIGSNLSSIVVSSQVIGKASRLGVEEKNLLGEIGHTAIQTASTMRDIVWLINPEFDTLDRLDVKMKDVAGIALRGMRYEFHSQPAIESVRLTPEFRRNIFMIYKEALTNIVRHAEATEVKITLQRLDHDLVLTISDDGKGLDESIQKSGQGLRNIKSRGAEIGADVQVEGAPGSGTSLRITAKIPS